MSDLALDIFGRPVLLAQVELAPEGGERVHYTESQDVLEHHYRRDDVRATARQRSLQLSEDTDQEVRGQAMDDLVDIISASDDRAVKLVPARGHVKRELGYLTDHEVVQVVRRLQHRGMDESDIKRGVIDRLSDDRRDGIIARVG